MFDEKTCSLLVPTTSGVTPLPMRSIWAAEQRCQEVAFVNAQKAPELLATFNVGYLEVKEALTKLRLFLVDAEKTANLRRSVIILDEAPRILKEKGLTRPSNPGGSEDLRQAVIDADPEHQRLLDRVHIIEAMIELLEGKAEGLVNAFTSVKKILGGENDWRGLNQNRRLSAGADLPAAQPGMTVTSLPTSAPARAPSGVRSMFGAASTPHHED